MANLYNVYISNPFVNDGKDCGEITERLDKAYNLIDRSVLDFLYTAWVQSTHPSREQRMAHTQQDLLDNPDIISVTARRNRKPLDFIKTLRDIKLPKDLMGCDTVIMEMASGNQFIAQLQTATQY